MTEDEALFALYHISGYTSADDSRGEEEKKLEIFSTFL